MTQRNKAVLITGASKGIGLAIARALSDHFDNMALVASSEQSFSSVAGEFGDNAKFYGTDFSCTSNLKKLATQLAENHPHFDVLINNCGVYEEGPFKDAELSSIEHMLDINTKAPITLTRLLLPQIQRGRNPIIINISSIQATSQSKNVAAYAASKAALSAFSNALRKELNPTGIRVTVVEPSGVNTWDDPAPKNLLLPEEVGNIVRDIVFQNPQVQIETITVSAVSS